MGIKSGMGNTVIYRLRNEAGEITAGKEIGHAKSSGMENPAAFLLGSYFIGFPVRPYLTKASGD